jgi:hypothetical protein
VNPFIDIGGLAIGLRPQQPTLGYDDGILASHAMHFSEMSRTEVPGLRGVDTVKHVLTVIRRMA